MAERLTNTLEETPTKGFGLKFCSDRNCNSDEDCCNCYAFNETINKLRQLEDVMEKYGIEDLEQYLLKMRKVDKELRDTIQQLHTIIDSIGYDRDNWQKACELACEKIVDIFGSCPIDTDNWERDDVWCEEHCKEHEKLLCWDRYFYQQAKRGWNINK